MARNAKTRREVPVPPNPGKLPRKGDQKKLRSAGGASMAVAALRMEALCTWAIERAEDFPRKVKFSLGDRWIEANLAVVEHLVEATYTREKRPALLAASRALVRARVVARDASRPRPPIRHSREGGNPADSHGNDCKPGTLPHRRPPVSSLPRSRRPSKTTPSQCIPPYISWQVVKMERSIQA